MKFFNHIPLSQYSSWKVGGEAEFYCCPESLEDIISAENLARDNDLKMSILSGGTNVLISDKGVQGMVLHLHKFNKYEVVDKDGSLRIIAQAGTSKSELLKVFLRHKLSPAEFLAGIPGDVGGGVVMNAGVGELISPREFGEIVEWIDVLHDGKVTRWNHDKLSWAYRHCDGWQPGIIVKVCFFWPNSPDIHVVERAKSSNQGRLKKQPLEWPSCGSVFVNPEGHKAGQLIDFCGLRGFRIGGAEVSEKHANFIINRDHASATDIDRVIRHVQKTVLDQTGIPLRTEVVYLGRWEADS